MGDGKKWAMAGNGREIKSLFYARVYTRGLRIVNSELSDFAISNLLYASGGWLEGYKVN